MFETAYMYMYVHLYVFAAYESEIWTPVLSNWKAGISLVLTLDI
jgi:hypothetical protein